MPKNYRLNNLLVFESYIIEFIDHVLVNFGNKTKTEEFLYDLILRFDEKC